MPSAVSPICSHRKSHLNVKVEDQSNQAGSNWSISKIGRVLMCGIVDCHSINGHNHRSTMPLFEFCPNFKYDLKELQIPDTFPHNFNKLGQPILRWDLVEQDYCFPSSFGPFAITLHSILSNVMYPTKSIKFTHYLSMHSFLHQMIHTELPITISHTFAHLPNNL